MNDPTKVPADPGAAPEPTGPRTSQEILHGHMPELDGLRGMAIVIDMLAWGALMAALARGSKGLAGLVVPARFAMIAGAAGLATAWAVGGTFDHHGPHVQIYGFTAMGLLGAGLVITLITLPVNSALAIAFWNPVLAYVGLRSYAIYVLHVAITLWARSSVTRNVADFTGSAVIGVAAGAIAILILSVAAATLTARFLEEPCLRLRRFFAARNGPEIDSSRSAPGIPE